MGVSLTQAAHVSLVIRYRNTDHSSLESRRGDDEG